MVEFYKKHPMRILAGIILLQTILEIMAFLNKGSFWEFMASRIWMAGFIILLCYTVYIAGTDIASKVDLAGVIGVFVIIALFMYIEFFNKGFLSYESCIEVASGLEQFKPNFGYTSSGFLGYPCRQYALNAIPSLLFGKSITSLHFGFSLLFYIGIILFSSELRKIPDYRNGYVLLPVSSMLCYRYLANYFRLFEQTITPISITMICFGLFLSWKRKPSFIKGFLFSWALCMLATSYTPGVAALGIICIFLLMTKNKFNLIFCVEASVFYICQTFFNGRENNVFALNTELTPSTILSILYRFFFESRFLGIMSLIVILYFIASLTFNLGLENFIVSLWSVLVIIFSIVEKGYAATPEGTFNFHRALIIIPFITYELFLLCIKKEISRYMLYTLSAIFLLTGTVYLNSKTKEIYTYDDYAQAVCMDLPGIEARNFSDSEYSIVFIGDQFNGLNIYDYFTYFAPNKETFAYSSVEEVNTDDFSKPAVIFSLEENISEIPGIDFNIKEVKYKDFVLYESLIL